MSSPQEPREVFPVQFFDPGQPPSKVGKDFAVHSMPADLPVIEPDVEEVGAGPDPKGSSVTGSAELSDLIPSAAEVLPVDVELEPEQTTTDPLKQTSSTNPATGKSEPLAVPAAVTTPTTGSVKPQKRATAPKQSASPAR